MDPVNNQSSGKEKPSASEIADKRRAIEASKSASSGNGRLKPGHL